MKKWEYDIQDIHGSGQMVKETLNRMGEQGWELVLINGGSYYFRREKK